MFPLLVYSTATPSSSSFVQHTINLASSPSVSYVTTRIPSSSHFVQHTINVAPSPSVSLVCTPIPSSTVCHQPTVFAGSSDTSVPQFSLAPTIPAHILPSSSDRSVVCPRLVHKQASKHLPSSSIARQKLVPPAEVIAKCPKLLVVNKAPTLVMKLAQESFFGENLMAQSIVMGCREYPGLPSAELCKLKKLFIPSFHHSGVVLSNLRLSGLLVWMQYSRLVSNLD